MPRGKVKVGPYRGGRSRGMRTNPIDKETLTSPQNANQLDGITYEDSNLTSQDVTNEVPNPRFSAPTVSQPSNEL